MRIGRSILQDFIINNVRQYPANIAKFTASHFNVTVTAVNYHLAAMVRDGILTAEGSTRSRKYNLADNTYRYYYPINSSLAEHNVWNNDIEKHFSAFPDNVRRMWAYCFSEMFNNAIDHSGGKNIYVLIRQNLLDTTIFIQDDGIGIFNKIGNFLGISDAREVATELAKGKFTTDKKNHTGEGIFFTSRMVDKFFIWSCRISWMHNLNSADWVFDENVQDEWQGTSVSLTLYNKSERTVAEVFNKYGNPDFDSTVIPVVLMDSTGEGLVSRSQARRVLSRLESFENIVLDFRGIRSIGQAFADEIFRVFPIYHPNISLRYVNAAPDVESMINRAKNRLNDAIAEG